MSKKIQKKEELIKYDNEKVMADLLPPDVLIEIAKVYTFGAKKYEKNNWAKGGNYGRIIASLKRHLMLFEAGEDLDEESGMSHVAHINCCAQFLLAWVLRNVGVDDRYKLTDESIKHMKKSDYLNYFKLNTPSTVKNKSLKARSKKK